MSPPVQPISYLTTLLDYLKTEESELWEWFSSTRQTDKAAASMRLELLKSAYRLERDDRKELYELADSAARKLGLDCSVTLYKAQNAEGQNVYLSYIPGEAHIVFQGPIQEFLSPKEMEAVLAHELTHFLLHHEWDGDFFVADQLLRAMASDVAAEASHFESVRLFSLYSEVLCDRGAFHVVEDPLATIGALLKLETGDREVNPESYLRQAEEIFSQDNPSSEGVTHPETFIRTRALQLWTSAPDDADAATRELVEGPARLESLDLLGRKRVEGLTRRLLDRMLKPDWLRTEATLAHARLYFDDFAPSDADDAADVDEKLAKELETSDGQLFDYYSYVLLDFVAVEQEHEEAPLAAALVLADRLGLKDRLRNFAAKELKLKKRDIDRVFKDADNILARALRSDP